MKICALLSPSTLQFNSDSAQKQWEFSCLLLSRRHFQEEFATASVIGWNSSFDSHVSGSQTDHYFSEILVATIDSPGQHDGAAQTFRSQLGVFT
mgnify:CR=1 FL=1